MNDSIYSALTQAAEDLDAAAEALNEGGSYKERFSAADKAMEAADSARSALSLYRKEIPSRKDLIESLTSMMDGMKEHEIQEITGLPEESCKKIWNTYVQALQN